MLRPRDLPVFGEAVRQIAVFYDGLVMPGALLSLGSGTWLTITVYSKDRRQASSAGKRRCNSARLLGKSGRGTFRVLSWCGSGGAAVAS
jgi:hypothetical protein